MEHCSPSFSQCTRMLMVVYKPQEKKAHFGFFVSFCVGPTQGESSSSRKLFHEVISSQTGMATFNSVFDRLPSRPEVAWMRFHSSLWITLKDFFLWLPFNFVAAAVKKNVRVTLSFPHEKFETPRG